MGESSLHHTGHTVGAAHLTPDSLVVGTSFFVLSFVDEGNTLSVVEARGLNIVASFNLKKGLVDVLLALTTFETSEHGSLVQSTPRKRG